METTPKSDRVDEQLEIAVANSVTDELVEALSKLIPQLTNEPETLDPNHLKKVVEAENTRLLVARWAGEIVGTLTLVTTLIPTSSRARIEDVVVDQAARGKGIGRVLTETAIEMAQANGIEAISLTSRPHRQAAHRLYESLDFQKQPTNVYTLYFNR